MEKRRPHYLLSEIKQAFADPAMINRTFVAKQGAGALGLDDATVVAVIQELNSNNFDKSMTSQANHRVWQDIYRPQHLDADLYVKFTVDAMDRYLLISFKEA